MGGGVDATRDRLAQRRSRRCYRRTRCRRRRGGRRPRRGSLCGAVGEAHLAGAAAVEPPACMISPSTRSAPNPDRLRAVLARR
jgi:hypothetical protein